MTKETDPKIVDLQRYLVSLEEFVKDLNAVVVEQGKEISRLKRELLELKNIVSQGGGEIRDPEKPPHY